MQEDVEAMVFGDEGAARRIVLLYPYFLPHQQYTHPPRAHATLFVDVAENEIEFLEVPPGIHGK